MTRLWALYGAQSGLILAKGGLYLRGFWVCESGGFLGFVWPERGGLGADFYDGRDRTIFFYPYAVCSHHFSVALPF